MEYNQFLCNQIQKSTVTLIDDNYKTLEQFGNLLPWMPNSLKIFYDNAISLNENTENFMQYIDSIVKLISSNEDIYSLNKPSSKNECNDLIFNKHLGNEIAKRIAQINDQFLQSTATFSKYVSKTYIEDIHLIQVKNKTEWVKETFTNLSNAELLITLLRLKQEIIRLNHKLILTQIKCIGVSDYRFDRMIPVVSMDRQILFQNDTAYCTIVLGAYNSKIKTDVTIENCETFFEYGKQKAILPTKKTGFNIFEGSMTTLNNNEKTEFPIIIDYLVY